MKNKHNLTQSTLYDSVYGNEIPVEQYFVILFNAVPSRQATNINYDPEILNFIKKNNFSEHAKVFSVRKNNYDSYQTLYVNEEKELMIKVNSDVDKNNNLVTLEFYYNLRDKDTFEKQFKMDDFLPFIRTKKKSNINLVKMEHGSLDTENYDLLAPDIDLELNYGSKFTKIHNVIVNRLNTTQGKGIILLHGDPGTGKTSYIKYLTKLITDKDILFIPPSMAEMLSEPSIIPFLMEHKNSILIIEDAERVISDREGKGSPAGVSNILNLTDGILGDCLNIQVIATFNMKRENIDSALLRKGRLIAEHKFENLSVDDTNKLLKHLGKDSIVDKGMSLADIYNIDVELFKSTKESHKIGF